MDNESAQKIVRTSIRVMALLDELAGDLQKALSEPEFNEQRRIIGQVMGMVSTDLINPINALYPSLEIGSADGWQRAGELSAPHWLHALHKS